MKVILKQEVNKLGQAGDVINVTDGYARNFLIPRGMALPATPVNLRLFESLKQEKIKKRDKDRQQAEELAEKLKDVSCTIVVKANEEQLYGAVTNADIAQALEQEGIKVDKKDVLLEEPIKSLGVYQIPVKLHSEIKQQVKVWVVKK